MKTKRSISPTKALSDTPDSRMVYPQHKRYLCKTYCKISQTWSCISMTYWWHVQMMKSNWSRWLRSLSVSLRHRPWPSWVTWLISIECISLRRHSGHSSDADVILAHTTSSLWVALAHRMPDGSERLLDMRHVRCQPHNENILKSKGGHWLSFL